MDIQLKKKWVEALRSGKYDQGRAALRSGDSFCCLGVLCDVSNLGEWGQDEYTESEIYCYAGKSSGDLLPFSLREHVGINGKDQEYLWKMNDESKASFEQIAAFIETHL